MSRVGKAPIAVPDGVNIEIAAGEVRVKGPKGTLVTPLPHGIRGEIEDGELVFTRAGESKRMRSLHGVTRALAANAVQGVTEGFVKELEVVGIGYRARMEGGKVTLHLGYSHPVLFQAPEGITVEVQDNTKIAVRGTDKQRVGQVAAEIRRLRPPDAYKGKGIRYKGEQLRLKVGKAATGARA
jgi:large subunit ribosomal protein L6